MFTDETQLQQEIEQLRAAVQAREAQAAKDLRMLQLRAERDALAARLAQLGGVR